MNSFIAKQNWEKWRRILDRIIANPHYRYDDPQKWLLLKLAKFAFDEIGHFNYLQYKH